MMGRTANRYHCPMDVLHRPGLRGLTEVSIALGEHKLAIFVDGHQVFSLADEREAHHWAKHVVECVNSGLTEPRWIQERLPRVCDIATRNNLHTGYPAAC